MHPWLASYTYVYDISTHLHMYLQYIASYILSVVLVLRQQSVLTTERHMYDNYGGATKLIYLVYS